MMTDKENIPEFESNESVSREGGYKPYNRDGGYNSNNRYNRNEGNGGYNNRRSYGNNYESGGYRPYNNRYENNSYSRNNEGGEHGGYNKPAQSYNPRFNNGGGNRYDNNRGYNKRPQQGYRPNYNREDGEMMGGDQRGGYTPRYNQNRPQRPYNPNYTPNYNNQGGYRPAGGGQRPRFNTNGTGGYGRPQQPGRRPRINNGGYNPNAKYSLKKQIEYKNLHTDPDEPIRLNKFLANAGICSRREADEFITAGVVSVNGAVVTELGTKIKYGDEVKFHDQPVNIERKVYVILNKPKDCVTTSDDPQERKTVMDLVKGACKERIYPVGRLDRNTTGVLLLTNDGDLASKLTHPKYLKKKIYHVYCDKKVSSADLDRLLDGITLEDGDIRADAVSYASDKDKSQVGIEIHSGRNRIVRRMFEALGYRVVKLDRVFFAGLTKKGLRRGDWRFLTEAEVNFLRMGSFE